MTRASAHWALLLGALLAAPLLWPSAAAEELSPAGRAFNAEDLYYYDEDGMEMPLQVVPRLCVVHVRGGKRPDEVRTLIEGVPEVGAVEFRPEQGLFLVGIKESIIELHYEMERRLAILLQLLSTLNSTLGEAGYAAPVAQVQGRTLALSDTFSAEFKSFVTAQEIESFNAANQVGTLRHCEAPEGWICLRVKPAAGRNPLQMVHLYHEDPRVRAARPVFVPLFPLLSVRAELDVSATMVGDDVTYRLVVSREPNVNVDWSMLTKDTITLLPEGISSEGLVIREDRELEPREMEGRIEEVREYVLVFYEVGDFVLPELRVYYTVGDDPTPLEADANPVDVHVSSLIGRGVKDINSLPKEVGTEFQAASPRRGGGLLLAGVSLVAASGAGAVWRVLTSRRRRGAPAIGKEAIAREEALRRLELLPERIRAEGAAEDAGVANALRSEVDGVLRGAIEAVYDVPSHGGSTSRLLQELERLPVEDEVIGLVERVLASYCDQRFLPLKRRPVLEFSELESLAGAVARIAAHLRAHVQGVVGRASATV